MIHLANPQPTNTFILPVPDIASNAKWVAHIKAIVPRFSVVYSNNPLVIQLFTEADYTVKRIPPVNREDYQGTIVRDRLRTDDTWSELVPSGGTEFLHEINASDRLNGSSSDDHSLPH
jgi:nicotinamide-nucleotide adenylyltransferase